MKENPFLKWVESPSSAELFANKLKKATFRVGGLRVVDAHEVAKLGHNGWYCENNQGETFVGVVVQIPARKGVALFLPGYREPWTDGIGVDTRCTYDDAVSCAYAADGIAERYAEESREYHAKDQAEQQIEALREGIQASRDKVRAIIAGIRDSVLAPVICLQLREDIRREWRAKSRAVRQIAKLEDNPWLAVES